MKEVVDYAASSRSICFTDNVTDAPVLSQDCRILSFGSRCDIGEGSDGQRSIVVPKPARKCLIRSVVMSNDSRLDPVKATSCGASS
jgi:hypothetical protein